MRLLAKIVSLVAVLAGTVVLCLDAAADSYKSHGEFLHTSGKYKVVLLEMDGWISIRLVGKERGPGGPVVMQAQRQSHLEKFKEELGKREPRLVEEGPTIREENEIELALLRSEVIQTAEPNYLSNPGFRYRIYVVGGAAAPMYFNSFESGAANVREDIWNEAFKLYSQSGQYTIEQEALYWGMMLAVEALHSSWRLPADLPLTLLRSTVGMYRIGAEDYHRRQVGRTQRFAGAAEGQEFHRTMQDEDELANVRDHLGPRYKRGIVSDAGGQTVQAQRRDNARDHYRQSVERRDFRNRQLQGPQDRQLEDRLAEPGRPLTAHSRRLGALNAAQRRDTQDMELLRGDRTPGRDARFDDRVAR